MPTRAVRDRNAARVPAMMRPAELVELDGLAARMAEPRYSPNCPAAFRAARKYALNAEVPGPVEVGADERRP